MPGEDSMLTCQCPAVTAWVAQSGNISGASSNTARFTAYGVMPGDVTILARCQGEAQAETVIVTIGAPLAPAPHSKPLCSIGFDFDKRRPTRIDNAARACLDDVALNMQQDFSTTLLVIGEDAGSGALAVKSAQQRAINTKDYLVRDKGIDGSRIKVVTSDIKKNQVENRIIPEGAVPDQEDVSPVDESRVKPIAR
jgi:hypothetical protein